VSTDSTSRPAATDCWPPLPGVARRRATRLAVFAFAVDLLVVVAFAAIGRRNHDEGSGIGLTLEVAAPFLIGVAVGWAVFRLWQAPLWSNRAIGMWLVTIVVGITLRRTLFDRGIAVSFVIVATIFLGVFLLGWRGIASRFTQR
jgi:hypothetical protein